MSDKPLKSISTPAIIEGVRSRKDGSVGLTVTTPELSPEEKTVFFELQGVNLDLVITPVDEKPIGEIVVDTDLNQKSQSQRIRDVLYVIWHQNTEGLEFQAYYRNKTEKIIEDLKKQII